MAHARGGDQVSEVRTSTVMVAGEPCRVLEKGDGEPVAFLAGLCGVPSWLPFLDQLAETRRVVVPSLPGFPGGAPTGFRSLDGHLDWITATLDLLDGCGLIGADVVAASVAGMLAAEVAALAPSYVRRLVLIGSWGLYDPADPGDDYFAQVAESQPALLAQTPEKVGAALAPPENTDQLEWAITLQRANEAAARISWPMGDRGLRKRLRRITSPTLLLWGEHDRIVPASYADRFAQGIAGPTDVAVIPGAGHLSYIDEPEVTAKHVAAFLDS